MFSSDAREKVLEPRIEFPFAKSCCISPSALPNIVTKIEISHTGNPMPWISATSRKRPSMTTPAAPTTLARVAIKPPKQAEYISLGWEMNMILPGSHASIKCFGGVGDVVSFASTIFTVTASPMMVGDVEECVPCR
jgi:hypothetical protein